MPGLRIHQIFYDAESHRTLDAGFIPLDNSSSTRPDWFEFWPILNFLNSHELDADCWYGFLSPKFAAKTGFSSSSIAQRLAQIGPYYDVALFSPWIADIALYQNAFEQSEDRHPGTLADSRKAIGLLGLGYDVDTAVGTLSNSVFSNYVIARPAYWKQWHDLAMRFHQICTEQGSGLPGLFDRPVPYDGYELPVRVFIQERLSSLVLSTGSFRTYVPFEHTSFGNFSEAHRTVLILCEELKRRYADTGDFSNLEQFRTLRRKEAGRLFPFG